MRDAVTLSDKVKKVDPLIVNFSGTAAQLTDTKYQFDLNSDGRKDNISFVQPGSGFLAVDKNDDGKINNGKELFGPNAGNGFDELAKYDADGNQWIDESDPIFKQLKIWTKDAKGNDTFLRRKKALQKELQIKPPMNANER